MRQNSKTCYPKNLLTEDKLKLKLIILRPARTARWPLHKTCGANVMTNTDERVHYGFHSSDAVRACALGLRLIELDGKLIKVLLIFTAESAKTGGEASAVNTRSKSAHVASLERSRMP